MEMEQGVLSPDAPIVAEFRLLRRAPSARQWQALRAYVGSALPGLLAFLERRNGRLRQSETDICVLLRLGFPLKQISMLMGMSYQNLSLTRKRLLKKVYGMEGGARDFDARIRQEG